MGESPIRVLAVCAANKGRSAVFHTFFAKALRDQGVHGIEIDSAGAHRDYIAGLEARGNLGLNESAARFVIREGGDPASHRAKPVTLELIERATHVLTFTTDIRDQLRSEFPDHAKKIMTVRGFLSGKPDAAKSKAMDVDDVFQPLDGDYRGKYPAKSDPAWLTMVLEVKRASLAVLKKLQESRA